jgi:hypothetical protein
MAPATAAEKIIQFRFHKSVYRIILYFHMFIADISNFLSPSHKFYEDQTLKSLCIFLLFLVFILSVYN